MRHHICPQCEARRVQFRNVGRVRRIFCLVFNLNPYSCGGCGWEGVLWEGEGRGWKKILLAPSTLTRLFIAFIAFTGILYAVSFMGGGSSERKKAALEVRPVKTVSAPQVVDAPPLVVPAASPPVHGKAGGKLQPQPQEKAPTKASAPMKFKTKVIGNSDSKRYHLPGMKYYDQVKAYHRVEFSSEAAAIAAGYHRAPR